MNATIKSGIRTGLPFGVISLFLLLIGFNLIGSEMLAGIWGGEPLHGGGNQQGYYLYLAMLAVFAGVATSKKLNRTSLSHLLVGGTFAGLAAGFMTVGLSYFFGVLQENMVNIRRFLTQISPRYISLLLFQKTPLTGALIVLGIFVGVAILGTVLNTLYAKYQVKQRIASGIQRQTAHIQQGKLILFFQGSPYRTLIIYLVSIGILFLVPRFLSQNWNFTLGTVGIYILMGLGLNIVVGMAGLLDLGYVAFFAVGAYTTGLLTAPAPHGIMLDFWIVLPLSVIFAAIAGIVLGVPVLRMRGDYLAIVTLGFGEIIRVLVKSDLLSDFTGGPQGVRAIGGPALFGKPFTSGRDYVYLIIIGILLVIFVTSRLRNSKVGRAWVAMREDETVAQAMGINTYQAKLLAFAIGAAFAGLGGALFASRNQYTGPADHNLMVSINILCLIIVGGMGSIPGVILGAFVLKGFPEILRQISDYRILAFGALLVIMMILRPEGIWPSKRRKLEVHAPHEEET